MYNYLTFRAFTKTMKTVYLPLSSYNSYFQVTKYKDNHHATNIYDTKYKKSEHTCAGT